MSVNPHSRVYRQELRIQSKIYEYKEKRMKQKRSSETRWLNAVRYAVHGQQKQDC